MGSLSAANLKDVDPAEFLDALYQQGFDVTELRGLIGLRVGQITSTLLRGGKDRGTLERALDIVKGADAGVEGDDEYTKLVRALVNRDLDPKALGYKGPKDTSSLVSWIGDQAKGSVSGGLIERKLDSAVMAVMPKAKLVGGRTYTPEKAAELTQFRSGALKPPTPQDAGYAGVRGQGGTGRGTDRGAPAPAPAAPPPGGVAPPGGGNVHAPAGLLPDPGSDPEAVRALIRSTYGGFDVLLDNPEVAAIMDQVAKGTLSAELAAQRFQSTNYYKTTHKAQREWTVFERTAPGDAARKKGEQATVLKGQFQEIGFTPDEARLNQLVDMSLRYGWTDDQVKRFIGSEVHYDPDNVKGGTLGQLKALTKEWMVPLSEQTMSSWAQGIVSGASTAEDFTSYLRDQAKSMFPGMAISLDQPEMTTRKYFEPYAQDAARTLGINAEDIDWNDPKWMRAANQVDAKTGQRTVMARADWVTTLMTDPQYEYDKSAQGIKSKQDLTSGLMASFGISI